MKKLICCLAILPLMAFGNPENRLSSDSDTESNASSFVAPQSPYYHDCSITPGPGGVTVGFTGMYSSCYPIYYEYWVYDFGMEIYHDSGETRFDRIWCPTTYAVGYTFEISFYCSGADRDRVYSKSVRIDNFGPTSY